MRWQTVVWHGVILQLLQAELLLQKPSFRFFTVVYMCAEMSEVFQEERAGCKWRDLDK